MKIRFSKRIDLAIFLVAATLFAVVIIWTLQLYEVDHLWRPPTMSPPAEYRWQIRSMA
jgi:hypothetical protein